MKHKCDGCRYKGEHQEMMFRPMGVCTRSNNLAEAVKAYEAEKCPYKKEKLYTLEEIANKICDSYEECTEGECPGFYYCRHTRGHGVLVWLEKLVNGDLESR